MSTAYGIKLSVNLGSGLQLIPKLEEFKAPTVEPETDEVTTHDSDEGAFESKKTGRKKHNNAEFTIIYQPGDATHQALEDEANDTEDKDAPQWQVEYADGDVHTFRAWVKGFNRQTPQNKHTRVVVPLEITGPMSRS